MRKTIEGEKRTRRFAFVVKPTFAKEILAVAKSRKITVSELVVGALNAELGKPTGEEKKEPPKKEIAVTKPIARRHEQAEAAVKAAYLKAQKK